MSITRTCIYTSIIKQKFVFRRFPSILNPKHTSDFLLASVPILFASPWTEDCSAVMIFCLVPNFIAFYLFLASHFPFCARSLILDPSSRHRKIELAMSSEASDRQEFKVLGICGGIGSGKSSASKLLVSELGCLDHLGEFFFLQNHKRLSLSFCSH